MNKEMKIELDLGKLSPMHREKILKVLANNLWDMYRTLEIDVGDFAEGEAKKEMIEWRDATNNAYNYIAGKKRELLLKG